LQELRIITGYFTEKEFEETLHRGNFLHWKEMISIPTLFTDRITLTLASGLLAALLSYHINSYALKKVGEEAIIFLAPLLEELLKTGLALISGGGVFLSHVTFGTVEALYDMGKNRGNRAYWAGFASLVSHSVFGAITQYSIYYIGKPLLGLSLAVAIHVVWNCTVLNSRKLR
jgi:hypothetical protein